MVYLIEQFYIALMLSANYVLIAVGFTLFFFAFNIVHFSHGDVAMIGSFVGIILYTLVISHPSSSSLSLSSSPLALLESWAPFSKGR